jgi:hypothetical protein
VKSGEIPEITTLKRCWVNYNKEPLCRGLRTMDWNITDDTVQGYWNEIECKILDLINFLLPMSEFVNNHLQNQLLLTRVRNFINTRKRLFKRQKP